MSSTWPESYDNFVIPNAVSRMNDPTFDHAKNHSLANSALANIQAFLGATPNFNVLTNTTVATGDLSGLFPGPTVHGIQGIPVTGTPGNNNVLTYNGTTGQISWQPTYYAVPYTKTGFLSVTSGALRFPAFKTMQIVGTIATVNTAPVGSSVILDILKNGTSIYTTTNNRPTILANTNISQIPIPTPDISAAAVGDYFQINILQVGSSTTGSDLSVVIIVE